MSKILGVVTSTILSIFVAVPEVTAPQTLFQPVIAPVKIEEVIKVPIELQGAGKCESDNRQFDENGNVLRGMYKPHDDVGKYQINERIWLKKSIELGYDIYTEQGNTKMALWLYEKYGLLPWKASFNCWKYEIAVLFQANEKMRLAPPL